MHRVRSLHIARYGLLPILVAPLGCAFELCADLTPCKDATTEATASASTLGSTSSTSTHEATTEGESSSTTSTATTSTTQATASATSATSTTQTTADTTSTTTGPACGDGVEECDPADPEGPYCDLGCKELVAVAVAAAGDHTCALLEQKSNTAVRRVRCWGNNLTHQLGYVDTAVSFKDATPRAVYANLLPDTFGNLDLPATVATVVAGPDKTCFLLDTGNLRCTGEHTCDFPAPSDDDDGDGAIDLDLIDFPDIEIPNYKSWKFTGLSIGTKHTCATISKNEGDQYLCWQPATALKVTDNCEVQGNACPDKMGFTSTEIKYCPGDSPTEGCTHASGYGGSCYIDDIGALRCWGLNSSYSEGLEQADQVSLCGNYDWKPERYVVSVAAGPSHYCAIMYDMDPNMRKVFCWGAGSDGRLGPASSDGKQPISASTPFCAQGKCNIRQLALGNTFSCAVSADDELYCWGTPCPGTAWKGAWKDVETAKTPVLIPLPDSDKPSSISAGFQHICIASKNKRIYCMGTGQSGQTGQTGQNACNIPKEVTL